MAVDLNDLVASVKRECSPPGSDLFPDAQDDEWLGQLVDSFWEAKLFGFFANFSSTEDGLVQPIHGSTDLERSDQQLIVLFAGIRTVRMKLMNTNTMFRAAAGSVSFETQNSANLLTEILKELQQKINIIYANLSAVLGQTQVYYFNAISERTDSILHGDEKVYGPGGSWGGGMTPSSFGSFYFH